MLIGSSSSVMVLYFDVMSIMIAPTKADSILMVDADAVLSPPGSLQFFQTIAGR
jgi:hypothetical protein